jgi:hypothetical protein
MRDELAATKARKPPEQMPRKHENTKCNHGWPLLSWFLDPVLVCLETAPFRDFVLSWLMIPLRLSAFVAKSFP